MNTNMYENEPEFETEPKPAENISADGLEKISENPLDFDICGNISLCLVSNYRLHINI